jgi:signal transduction histidine kinase
MSIRRTLLLFFLLMGLAPATIITGLAFFQAREALKLEITRNLTTQATALMEQIDRTLFERMLHVHTWSELEIMQEVRVGDVDKRLSHLLFDLNRHYNGVYKALYCSNRERQIVAASTPSMVGMLLPDQSLWLTAPLVSGETRLAKLAMGPKPDEANLEMEASIHDPQHKEDESVFIVGKLHAVFDWGEIFHLLDQHAKNADDGTPRSLAVLFDADGRIIAASAALRTRGLLFSTALANWRTEALRDAVVTDTALGFGEVLAGVANSQGYQHFPGFGWTVQIFQPTELAFAPIDRMAAAFFLLLAITSAVAVVLSLLIAKSIAQPIVRLTELTRRFMSNEPLAEQIVIDSGHGEIGELAQTFLHMIRDLQKSHRNLVRAAKLAVVGEMAATMAHEVRTPLGIMRSSAQMLQREPGLTETSKEMLGFILSENDRLNRLISSLLDCARPRQPVFKEHHLHDIVARALDLLSMQVQRKSIRLETKLNAPNDLLICDEEHLLQVLLNLVMNAVQILPAGGHILIRSFTTQEGLVLQVDDDGPGIPTYERAKVFDPFFTQREGGIGLGLTVVQQIIRTHDADISVGISSTGGARFQIFFPKQQSFQDRL